MKEAAKKGDRAVCVILAKEVLRARKAITKIQTSKAHLNSIQLQMKNQLGELCYLLSLKLSLATVWWEHYASHHIPADRGFKQLHCKVEVTVSCEMSTTCRLRLWPCRSPNSAIHYFVNSSSQLIILTYFTTSYR